MTFLGPEADRRFPYEKSLKRTFTQRKFAAGFGPILTLVQSAANVGLDPRPYGVSQVVRGFRASIHPLIYGMGSMIHLAVGRLEIDWGQNFGFQDHSALFQGEKDIANIPYYYAGNQVGIDFESDTIWEPIVELKEGLTKPLPLVIDRINLLGHTFDQCEKEFLFRAQFNDFDPDRFTFSQLRDALAKVDVTALSADYGDGGQDFGKFFRRELAPRLGLDALAKDDFETYHRISEAMENMSAYTVLHLLARNPHAASLPVQWSFNDIDTGGYARREDFVRLLDPSARFLIVTEGSSDAKIIQHALNLLRPHVADFFSFVDMEEGYPFSGTGNMFRFVQGLIGIAVQNKILVLFDNDAEGLANHGRCAALSVPTNMRILALPDLPDFTTFRTLGPDGEHTGDINGRAAAIECYLDLGDKARVQWTNFNRATASYQGELEGKTRYMRKFLEQRERKSGYDYTRIEQVLDVLIGGAVSIAATEVAEEWQRHLEY